jgi:hypothetical protein
MPPLIHLLSLSSKKPAAVARGMVATGNPGRFIPKDPSPSAFPRGGFAGFYMRLIGHPKSQKQIHMIGEIKFFASPRAQAELSAGRRTAATKYHS